MLGDPIVLKDNAAADVTFNIISQGNLKDGTFEVIRNDATSSPSAPRLMTVRQRITGRGDARVRRTLVSFTKDIINATTGRSSRVTYNASWVFPLNGDAANTDLYHLLTMSADLLLSTGALAVDTTRATLLLQGNS